MQRTRIYRRPSTDGSRTLVIHDSAPREVHPANPDNDESPNEDRHDHSQDQPDDGGAPRLVLNLQGGGVLRKKKQGQKVVWKEDVIDNEGCGKKKSKICCIYHKPRKFDESSDESSDDSDCERSSHHHNHASGSGEGSSTGNSEPTGATVVSSTTATVTTVKAPERNAYEIQPHNHHPHKP